MKKPDLKRMASLIYAATIIALSFLFFTNDFGLVDIRKTAVIIGAGIDLADDGVSVTAQLAVPQPSENGENTQYIEVEGRGVTVAAALNEINKKTGFYPKLVFCKLLILGESCTRGNIFEILDYFYRDDYTQLTPVIAMCGGSAGELLASKMRFGNTAVVSIERLLSDEAKKSGNVSTVNLKIIGMQSHSPSRSCYMPFIRSRSQSAEGGGPAGGAGGEQSGQSGADASGGSGEEQTPREFLCDRTAIFRDGMFAGVLDEEQTFALNLLRNNVRHVFVPCTARGKRYTLGLRGCRGSVSVAADGGKLSAVLSFSAVAQVSDVDGDEDPSSVAQGVVPDEVLAGGAAAIGGMFSSLMSALRAADCDVLEFGALMHRFCYDDYVNMQGSAVANAATTFDISLRSAG